MTKMSINKEIMGLANIVKLQQNQIEENTQSNTRATIGSSGLVEAVKTNNMIEYDESKVSELVEHTESLENALDEKTLKIQELMNKIIALESNNMVLNKNFSELLDENEELKGRSMFKRLINA